MNDDLTQQSNQFQAKKDDDSDLSYSAQAGLDHDLDKGQSPFLGANDPIVKEDVSAGKRSFDVDDLSNDSRLNSQIESDAEEVNDTSTAQEIGFDVSNIEGQPSNDVGTEDEDGGDDTTGRIDNNQKL